jgi:hypothetical protein
MIQFVHLEHVLEPRLVWSLIINVQNPKSPTYEMCIVDQDGTSHHPRSIRRGRKRPLLIVFDSFGSDRITVVFHRIVNERKRSDTPFSGRLRQLLTVYDTTENGRNTITTKWAIYTP